MTCSEGGREIGCLCVAYALAGLSSRFQSDASGSTTPPYVGWVIFSVSRSHEWPFGGEDAGCCGELLRAIAKRYVERMCSKVGMKVPCLPFSYCWNNDVCCPVCG